MRQSGPPRVPPPPSPAAAGAAASAPVRRYAPDPLRRVFRTAVACAAAAMLVALSTQYARTYSLAREAARLDQHRRDLIVANASLRDEIHRLETDDRYIERLAREQLGLVRPGEIELFLVPEGAPPPPDTVRGAGGEPALAGDRTEPQTASKSVPRTTWWMAALSGFLKHLFGWPR